MNFPFLARIALRDAKKRLGRLMLFVLSIVLGIAALVAINSFGDNLQGDIDRQAKELLGADLVISSRFDKTIYDVEPENQASEVEFPSMILFDQGTRLVQIKAIEPQFPFFGDLETDPPEAAEAFKDGKTALVDRTVLLQYNAKVGDDVKIGDVVFKVGGALLKAKGQTGITATMAPVVYIPYESLDATNLVQRGSRVNYNYYYRLDKTEDEIQNLIDVELAETLEDEGMRTDTVRETKESIGRAFATMTDFLNLVAFVALLLGCLGVASSVHVYAKEKLSSVAILRTLGLSGWQAFSVYLMQILTMGLIGSILGAILGSLIQFALPEVFANILPVAVEVSVSWNAVAIGIFTGVFMSLLFALIPLLPLRNTSPFRTLRASLDPSATKDYLVWGVYLTIILFIFGFIYIQFQKLDVAAGFTFAIILGFLLLTGSAQLLMWLVKKFFPTNWSYIWRQSLANLYRPNNQTLVLIISIGLGTALLGTMFFSQDMLIKAVDFADGEDRPNMVLFDIQSDQREEVKALAIDHDLPVLQDVPIVTMKLESINGVTKQEMEEDTTSRSRRRTYSREYRVTYRDSLIESETLHEGEWNPSLAKGEMSDKVEDDKVYISFEKDFAARANIKIGDEVVFNVQGALISTTVGSTRAVDWQRVQTNFMVVFPAGVLEDAPQFHVLVTRSETQAQAAQFQRSLITEHPNVSAIDLGLILETMSEIIDQISFVIQFMAAFSIITGLLVLLGSVIISKFQRTQESVLLRTLGASRNQITWINALEYLLLGTLAAGSGIFLSLASCWALAQFVFDTTFSPEITPIVLLFLGIVLITLVIGVLNSRGILSKSPLAVLRA